MAPTTTSWKLKTKHQFKTKREVTITGFYGGGSPQMPYDPFTIPAGLRCKQVTHGGGRVGFYLDELPLDLFPQGSALRHDATYYGVTILNDAVEDVTPVPTNLPSGKDMSPEAIQLSMDVMRQTAIVPHAVERRGWIWVYMDFRMDGTYRVTRKHEEAPLGRPLEVLYEGSNVEDAQAAWRNA